MRIATVIEEGKLGGPQVRMVRVAAAMHGAEMLVVMPTNNSGPFRQLCDAAGVRWHAVPMTRITREWRVAIGYLLFSPVEVLRLARLFRRYRIDLVHASGGSWQYKAIVAARLAGIPSVWHLNDTLVPEIVHRLFRRLSPLASGFIFASARSRDYYGAVLPDRPQEVIPSPVDVVRFDPSQPVAGDEDVLARLGSAPVIGTVANINRIKGFETLIRAAAELRRQVPGLRVLVVGPVHSNQRAHYAELVALAERLRVADAIEWVGARADVRPLLARMDVYVCSSDAESSPVAVWEAMAMGRPVVSTDVGDVPRHVTDGESGFIVPVRDHIALAARARELLSDPDRRAHFGAKARAEAVEAFASSRVAEKSLTLYRRVLEAETGRRAGRCG